MTTTSSPARWRATLLDLAIVAAAVLVYHLPYLEPGMPGGDYPSELMTTVNEQQLAPTPFDFPIWNPTVMCGRPEVGFWRPFRLFELLFAGLPPNAAQKAGVVLFHVLAGWMMYALLRDSDAGRLAALFGGVIYPLMPEHIARSAGHGHVHIVRFFALAPGLLLAFFRLRRGGLRAVVWLGLAIAAGLYADGQRALLALVLLGILLTFEVPLRALVRSPVSGDGRWSSVRQLAAFLLAFVVAVTLCSFELVNGFLGDPYRTGFSVEQREQDVARWSNDNVLTFVDRKGIVGEQLLELDDRFDVSSSRYVGVTLVAYLLAGLLLAPSRRLWTAGFLALLAVWLAAGPRPIGPRMLERWAFVLAEPDLAASTKLGAVVACLGLLALLSWIVARALRQHLPSRLAGLAGVAAVAVATSLFLFTAPYPLVKRIVFFLRDHRNPDWIQIAVLSTCVAYGAALGLGVIVARLPRRTWAAVAIASLLLLPVLDLLPYRANLRNQRSQQEIDQSRLVADAIAADNADVRVLTTVGRGFHMADGITVWHGKRLAWDYRLVTAPLRTRALVNRIHQLMRRGHMQAVGTLAGLANVKYLVDTKNPRLFETGPLQLKRRTEFMTLFENGAVRPLVQAWPPPHLVVAGDDDVAIALTARLADAGLTLIHSDGAATPALVERCPVRYVDDQARAAGNAPGDALLLPRADAVARMQVSTAGPFRAPALRYQRPAPHRMRIEVDAPEDFFLVVAESFHPWWRARLDGQPMDLYPGAFAFLGVFVPAGEHTVEMQFYRHWSHFLWLGVSLVAIACCLAFVALPRIAPTWAERFDRLGARVGLEPSESET